MDAAPAQNNQIKSKLIADVVEWTKEGGESRLYLPTIQRSLVWRNSQIINYWDSLLRGYPAGLMMIHHPKNDALRARSSDGNTCEVRPGDFLLFDGQQRLTAILLGLGEGQLKNSLKLWVDLGSDTTAPSDLRFVLRINSTGQPFGYQAVAPNNKFPLQARREKAGEWARERSRNTFSPEQVFSEADGNCIIDSDCAIQFQDIATMICDVGEIKTISVMLDRYDSISESRLKDFVKSLKRALNLPILFQLIDPAVIECEDEYIRFFGRLGQGGTALTNDELTYSIIKHQFPEVHDRMKEINAGQAGRMTSEVNLVLAALRVAKVSAPWNESGEWQIYGRPTPKFVARLKVDLDNVREEFQCLIPKAAGGQLKELLEAIRRRLQYDEIENPSGLPVILLARLPRQLIDVLLLMEYRGGEQPAIPLSSFVLYWLFFVADSEKAANEIFKRFCRGEPDWQPDSDQKLIRHFEELGISRRMPSPELLGKARNDICGGNHLLRAWDERFAAFDDNGETPTGDAIRVLTTNNELVKCVLLWVQRNYLTRQFPNYDPTSSRDEDLPIDLDHLIPHSKFGVDWRLQQKKLGFQDEEDNFRRRRHIVGNSVGNYRWLDASENRSRKADPIAEGDSKRDAIGEVQAWNDLIERSPWTRHDVTEFQKKIDLRSIAIYENLLDEAGLDVFVSESGK